MIKDTFVVTVSQLNSYLDTIFTTDTFLRKTAVHGEIANLNRKYSTCFLTLRDAESSLDCIVPDYLALPNAEDLTEGADVIAYGSVGIYRKSGKLRFSVSSFELFGEGEYFRQFEKLRKKLAAEGLFDAAHKKTLPQYPEHVGIITSSKGAAIRDIVNVSNRRNPHVKLSLYPVKVQGENAGSELACAVAYLSSMPGIDVIIIGRGGGSATDLAPFNDEELVRAVYASDIPVVSAVGHETDYTLCDFVSDLRAPTPSAAAELVVPDASEILSYISYLTGEMKNAALGRINDISRQAGLLCSGMSDVYISSRIGMYERDISLNLRGIYDIVKEKENALSSVLARNAAVLEALNPMEIINTGYALVEKDGKKVFTADDIMTGDSIKIRMKDGSLTASVTEKEKE